MTATWTTPATVVDGTLYGASWFNQYLRDNLDYLKARPVTIVQDLDGTVGSTSSTTFTNVAGAAFNITTRGSSRVMLVATGEWAGSGAPHNAGITFSVDGVDQGNATRGLWYNSATTVTNVFSITHLTSVLSDGLHTFALRYKISTGTITMSMFSMAGWEVA